jgi:hypothetical protein
MCKIRTLLVIGVSSEVSGLFSAGQHRRLRNVEKQIEKGWEFDICLDSKMTRHFTTNRKTTQNVTTLRNNNHNCTNHAKQSMSSLNTNDGACQNSRPLQRLQHSDSLYDALSFGMSQQMFRDGMPPPTRSVSTSTTGSLTLIDILDDALRIMEDDEEILRQIATLEPPTRLSRD